MSDGVWFRVEAVLESRGIVFCRCINGIDFKLTRLSTLGGRPVKSFDIPRAVLSDGTPDLEIVGFTLANREDLDLFVVGTRVRFENP